MIIVDFFKQLWTLSRVGTVVIVTLLLLIAMIFLFSFTNVWPAAHAWFNSTPCPDDQSCQWLKVWYWR